MLAAGDQAYRLALAKPSIADWDVLPSHLAQHVGVRRTEDRNLRTALKRDHGAEPRRPDRAFLGHFGQMRRAKNHVAARAFTCACRMAAEVSEVATAIAAQQTEVDDDSASGQFVGVAGGFARNCGLIFSFVV